MRCSAAVGTILCHASHVSETQSHTLHGRRVSCLLPIPEATRSACGKEVKGLAPEPGVHPASSTPQHPALEGDATEQRDATMQAAQPMMDDSGTAAPPAPTFDQHQHPFLRITAQDAEFTALRNENALLRVSRARLTDCGSHKLACRRHE